MDVAAVFTLIQRYKKRKYLIQQAIPASFEGRPVDFRVILQKDGSQKWTCSGIIAKIGRLGRINTNNASTLEPGREALQRIFGLTPEQALEKEKEIIGICTEACQIIEDAYGYYGDVGIDVMVDDNLKVWVLEINKSHQHEMAKRLKKDPDMYQRVVTRPLEYARVLAGF